MSEEDGFGSGADRLAGLFLALDQQGSDDENVEDPEALRRAEEAVAHDEPEPIGEQEAIEEQWSVVARQTGAVVVGLDEIARTLDAAGIPIGWDPYDPRDAVTSAWPGMGRGPWKTYALVVPSSQLDRARGALGGLAPDGVTFAWDGPSGPQDAGGSAPSPAGGPGLTRVGAEPGSPSGFYAGDGLSDNERMQRLAGSRPSGIPVGLVVVVVILVALIVVFLIMRG